MRLAARILSAYQYLKFSYAGMLFSHFLTRTILAAQKLLWFSCFVALFPSSVRGCRKPYFYDVSLQSHIIAFLGLRFK